MKTIEDILERLPGDGKLWCRACEGYHVPINAPWVCDQCGADNHDNVVRVALRRMSHTERFERRWEPHFGTAPWWDSIVYQHDYVGDWDGPAQRAIEVMVYDLALAQGIDTHHSCHECSRPYDAAACWECPTCTREEAEREARDAAERVAREAAWAKLTPEQRAAANAEIRIYLDGIIKRTVI